VPPDKEVLRKWLKAGFMENRILFWAQALRAAGAARVTAFDLSGLVMLDGTQGKDLADVCRVNADCFEREQKLNEVLP
jgi:hypothetical protein